MQENLLYLFSLVKFLLGYAPILALARGKSGSCARIVAYAIDALALLPASEIRSFALQKLTTTMPARYTSLLRSNYQAGDAALLTSIVKRFHDEHTIEMLADSYTTIYEANPTPECTGPLLALYAKMNCGMHRYQVVKLLLANGVLPAWLNAELPFDSYPKTRLLHQPLA